MFVKTFYSTLLNDPEYSNIQYDTLVMLNALPSIIGGIVQLQVAFSMYALQIHQF